MTARTKWASSGGGTQRQPPNIVEQLPDQLQIVYVGKHGNDADDGLNIESAKLTITAAIAAAVAQTPSNTNRFAIVIEDAGIYTEAFTVPSWVQLRAPSATIVAGMTLEDDADVELHELVVPTGAIGVLKTAGTSTSRFKADIVGATGASIGVLNAGVNSVLIYEVKTTYVENGFAVGDISTAAGHLHLMCEDIYIVGAGGVAIARTGSGTIEGYVAHVLEIGAGIGSGTAIYLAGGEMDLVVDRISCLNAYYVAAGTTLNLQLGTVTGAVYTAGVANVSCDRLYGVEGSDVSIGTGAGYTEVQTTRVLLYVKNTDVVVRFWVGHNQALASHVSAGGWLEVLVAWLDNDTQTVQSTLTGISASGATPALTGNLVTGVGWRVTMQADHTVKLEILKDAAIDRNARSRYWVGSKVTQVSP